MSNFLAMKGYNEDLEDISNIKDYLKSLAAIH